MKDVSDTRRKNANAPSGSGDADVAEPVYRTLAHDSTEPTEIAEGDEQVGRTRTADEVLHGVYAQAGRSEPRTVGGSGGDAGADSETTQMEPIVVPDDQSAEEVETVNRKDENFNEPTETELDAVTESGPGDNRYFDTDDAETEMFASSDDAATEMFADSSGGVTPDESTEMYSTTDPAETDLLFADGAAGVAGAGAGAGAAGGLGGPVLVEEEVVVEDTPEHRRGTTDLGLLFLRLGVGGLLLIHGLSTLIGFGGGMGVSGLQDQYIDWGWSFAVIVAVALPAIEIIAGVLLVVGLATPLGAALALVATAFQTLAVAADNSTGWNFLDGDNGAMLQVYLLLTVGALALQFTGPGVYGLDYSRTWSRRPLASSWIFVVVAIAVAVAAWWFVTGGLPFVG